MTWKLFNVIFWIFIQASCILKWFVLWENFPVFLPGTGQKRTEFKSDFSNKVLKCVLIGLNEVSFTIDHLNTSQQHCLSSSLFTCTYVALKSQQHSRPNYVLYHWLLTFPPREISFSLSVAVFHPWVKTVCFMEHYPQWLLLSNEWFYVLYAS